MQSSCVCLSCPHTLSWPRQYGPLENWNQIWTMGGSSSSKHDKWIERFRIAIHTKSYSISYIYIWPFSLYMYAIAFDINAASNRGPFQLFFHLLLGDPSFIYDNLDRISLPHHNLHSGFKLLLIRYIKTLGLELWKQNEKQICLIAYLIWKAIEKSEKTTISFLHHPNPSRSCNPPEGLPFHPSS